MYEELSAAELAGARAFQKLLVDRTGYPERGSLERFSEICGINGPVLGRYCRGEGLPGKANLQKLAPALGMSWTALRSLMQGETGGQAGDVALPDPDDMTLLSRALDEAQRLISKMRQQTVESTVANSRRKARSIKRMDRNNHMVDYDHQREVVLDSLVGLNRTRKGAFSPVPA